MSTKPYKGARDFYPEDKAFQKWLFDKWRKVCESFGYEEYDAPIVEPVDIYLAKTSEEIVHEQMYNFEDRGGRKVTLRPEMTPTVSRMVAGKRQELAYPLRWYSIPNVWRYERPQRGRLREHWQLNVDIFGVDGVEAEHELIMMADAIMHSVSAKRKDFEIKINSRKLIDYFLKDLCGLNEVESSTLLRLVDKKDKIPEAEFVAKLEACVSPGLREKGTPSKILDFLAIKALYQLPDELLKHESASRLVRLMELVDSTKITNVSFDASLIRGFDYYTDIVFEVFDTNPENNRSMFGGGRYDGLVANFGVDPVSTVGFGVGDVTFGQFLESHNLMPSLQNPTELYVVLIGDVYQKSLTVLSDLREMGVRLAVDTSGRKVDKQIKSAEKKNIKYVMFIGEEDLLEGRYNLKNIKTGEESKHAVQRLVTAVKDIRQSY